MEMNQAYQTVLLKKRSIQVSNNPAYDTVRNDPTYESVSNSAIETNPVHVYESIDVISTNSV